MLSDGYYILDITRLHVIAYSEFMIPGLPSQATRSCQNNFSLFHIPKLIALADVPSNSS